MAKRDGGGRIMVLAAGLLALGAVGCDGRYTEPRRTDAEWRSEIVENERRVAGEDGGRKTDAPVAESVWAFPRRLLEGFRGDTPLAAVQLMEDPYFPDRRRRGINRLVDQRAGRNPPYTERYLQIARAETDPLVRATAIRALNRSREPSAAGVFVDALVDRNDQVRLEAAKATANVPDPRAIPILTRMVADREEKKDIRIAAADALRNHRTPDSARALIRVLKDENFGLSWQARESLWLLFGRDHRFEPAPWEKYLAEAKPFG